MSDRNNINREYVEAYVPDKVKLAKYVNLAKGPERTMAEFAETCGVASASTFSRIANQKITKPLSTQLIQAIIKNAADPKEMSYEEFMRANGMIPKDDYEQGLHGDEDFKKRSEERENRNRTIRNIMTDELLARGCRLFFEPGSLFGEIPKSGFGLRRYSSFVIRIQGYEPLYWNFLVYSYDPQEEQFMSRIEACTGKNTRELYHLRSIMDEWSHLFLSDIWEPEIFKDIKHSVVFTDPEIYRAFCEAIRKIKVNTWMSVILVNMSKQEIIEEKILPRHDGREASSIFEEEKQSFDDDYDL